MKPQRLPRFSLIIPTYNRPQQLATCLQSLAQLQYPRDRFEVIIVDDGSPQPLEAVAAKFKDQLCLTLLQQNNAGPAAARNNGTAHAKGDYLAFIDDDCAPAPDYLQKLAARFAQTPNALVGGKTINALTDNSYSSVSQMLVDYIYAYFNAQQPRFFASNNFALPQALFHRIGGFDVAYPLAAAEDRDFCARWRSNGYEMIYAPEALIYHAHALTWRQFWRQHFNYGRGAFHFHQGRTKYEGASLEVGPISFYLDLLRYPLAQASGWRALRLTTLMAVTQAANAAGFFRERRTRKKMQKQRNEWCI